MGDNRLYGAGDFLCGSLWWNNAPPSPGPAASHPTQIAPGHTERSTQLPYRGSSNDRKASGSWKEMKERPLGKQNRWIFLWKFKFSVFSLILCENKVGKMRADVRATPHSAQYLSQALLCLSLLNQISQKPGSTLKSLIQKLRETMETIAQKPQN